MKQPLYRRDHPMLQPVRARIGTMGRKALIVWSIECAAELLSVFEERHPGDLRPRGALEAAHLWARGRMKLSEAKRAAQASRRAASAAEEDPAACAAACAMGQLIALVHAKARAEIFVGYALTAYHHAAGPGRSADAVAEQCRRMQQRLIYWEENIAALNVEWAPYLTRGRQSGRETPPRGASGGEPSDG